MYGARKEIAITLMATLLLLGGCSVFRKGMETGEAEPGSLKSAITYRDLLENNISTGGFYIRKASVEAKFEGARERFTTNVRVSQNGEFLASIRAFAGLEVARVYATPDEVIVLDRLGRTANLYSWNKLRDEFGLTYEMLPLIFGDVPEIRNSERRRLDCGMVSGLETGWAFMNIRPDCELVKASTIVLSHKASGREVTLLAADFKVSGDNVYPALVEVSEKGGSFHVKLSIEAIEVPWIGVIDFEVPAGYRINR